MCLREKLPLNLKSLLSWLRRTDSRWKAQTEPTDMSDLPSYPIAFAACAALSEELGGSAMSLRTSGPLAGDLHALVGQAMKMTGVRTHHLPGMVGQCLKWSHCLAPAIADVTGIPAWPTVGQFWKGKTRLFGPNWLALQKLWCNGVHPADLAERGPNGVDWHAWITLATGEVIDLTFPSTLAAVYPDTFGSLAGKVACGVADEIFPDHRYYPMIAGNSVIEMLQARSTLPFLAEHVDELGSWQCALVPL